MSLPNYSKCCQKVQVVCINNDNKPSILTVGKIYDAIDMETQTHVTKSKEYNLTSDDGFRDNHSKHLFITLSEFREERINKILED
jgi:hypothetical protein